MNLTLLFDHRFYRDKDGTVFSLQNYNYQFFVDRYLQIFDGINILARVSSSLPRKREAEKTTGEGVSIFPIEDWNAQRFPWAWRGKVRRTLEQVLSNPTAVISISPGITGFVARRILIGKTLPYGVEVVGDPYDAFSPGAMKHLLRPVFRWWFYSQLKRQCASACAAAYVTQYALQKRYPCQAYSMGISDVKISHQSLAPEARSFTTQKHPVALIHVGSFAQLYKAPEILIDACDLCVKGGFEVTLTMVGDGKHRPELEHRAARKGLGERIRFLGQLPAGEAIRKQLDLADMFVLPSRQEGLPRAMVEAMARGLPCVGSTVGGIPELLPMEDLVPPGDAIALAAKIREIGSDPKRLTLMSSQNLEKAKEYRETILQEKRLAFYRYVRDKTEEWIKSGKN